MSAGDAGWYSGRDRTRLLKIHDLRELEETAKINANAAGLCRRFEEVGNPWDLVIACRELRRVGIPECARDITQDLDWATQSCAHWLNWKCGIDMGAAREKVRTAHALQNLPKISAAMERGELSYAKVRAMTRVACAGTEDYFLSIALHGTAHHIRHWAHGGETKLSNLVTLCRFHHRKVHEGDIVIHVLDDGAIRFLKPDGTSFDGVAPNQTQPMGDWKRLPAMHEQRGIHIDKNTAVTRWCGESMDYVSAW